MYGTQCCEQQPFFANEATCSSFLDLTGFSLFTASGRTVGFDLLDTVLQCDCSIIISIISYICGQNLLRRTQTHTHTLQLVTRSENVSCFSFRMVRLCDKYRLIFSRARSCYSINQVCVVHDKIYSYALQVLYQVRLVLATELGKTG